MVKTLLRKCRDTLFAPLYGLYEQRLLRHIRARPAPTHIGLILDGNRRYGRQHKLSGPADAYMAGADKLDDLLQWCIEAGVPAITVWVFSTDNKKRPLKEVDGIFAAVEKKVEALALDPQVHKRHIRVRAVGRTELLPPSTLQCLKAAEAATAGYGGLQLTIAAGYGGREEIVDAVRGFLNEQLVRGAGLKDAIDLVTPEAIGRSLYAPDLPDPDLIIRTSGEIRLSGFLLWQSVSSEFYFTDVHWPAFRRIDFLRALRAFQQRQRRYGA